MDNNLSGWFIIDTYQLRTYCYDSFGVDARSETAERKDAINSRLKPTVGAYVSLEDQFRGGTSGRRETKENLRSRITSQLL